MSGLTGQMGMVVLPLLGFGLVVSVAIVCLTVWSLRRTAADRQRIAAMLAPVVQDPAAGAVRQALRDRSAETADDVRKLAELTAATAADLAGRAGDGAVRAEDVRHLMDTVAELLRHCERGDTLAALSVQALRDQR
jgi:hypothetical protein